MNQARRAPNQACNCKDESGNPKELLATLQEAEEKVGRLNSELERSNEEKLRRIGKRLVLPPPPFEHYKCPEGKGYHVFDLRTRCACKGERGGFNLFRTRAEAESFAGVFTKIAAGLQALGGQMQECERVFECPEGKGFHVAGFEGCVSRETLTQALHQTFERELAKAEAEKPESAREGSEPKTQAEEAT